MNLSFVDVINTDQTLGIQDALGIKIFFYKDNKKDLLNLNFRTQVNKKFYLF